MTKEWGLWNSESECCFSFKIGAMENPFESWKFLSSAMRVTGLRDTSYYGKFYQGTKDEQR